MPLREYRRTGENLEVTQAMIDDFKEGGYVIIRNMLDKEDVDSLIDEFGTADDFQKYAFGMDDGEKAKLSMVAWNYPGNDVSGMVARSEKYAGTCEKLMGGEMYHYHSKVIKKEAYCGARVVWHQDYGYWYRSGNLFPDMCTVFTALDPCTRENGCLQVLEGSHKCGRITHGAADAEKGSQEQADLERVELLKTKLEHLYVEMEPGDAIIFHCNVLHVSSKNDSAHRRWAFAIAYNMASNSSVVAHHHPSYNKLDKVPNSAIRDNRNNTDTAGKGFLDNTKTDWYEKGLKEQQA